MEQCSSNRQPSKQTWPTSSLPVIKQYCRILHWLARGANPWAVTRSKRFTRWICSFSLGDWGLEVCGHGAGPTLSVALYHNMFRWNSRDHPEGTFPLWHENSHWCHAVHHPKVHNLIIQAVAAWADKACCCTEQASLACDHFTVEAKETAVLAR